MKTRYTPLLLVFSLVVCIAFNLPAHAQVTFPQHDINVYTRLDFSPPGGSEGKVFSLPDSTILVVYRGYEPGVDESYLSFTKVNRDGTIIYSERRITIPRTTSGYRLATNPDSGFVVITSQPIDYQSSSYRVYELDNASRVIWTKDLSFNNPGQSFIRNVVNMTVLQDGKIVLLSYIIYPVPMPGESISVLSTNGDSLFSREMPGHVAFNLIAGPDNTIAAQETVFTGSTRNEQVLLYSAVDGSALHQYTVPVGQAMYANLLLANNKHIKLVTRDTVNQSRNFQLLTFDTALNVAKTKNFPNVTMPYVPAFLKLSSNDGAGFYYGGVGREFFSGIRYLGMGRINEQDSAVFSTFGVTDYTEFDNFDQIIPVSDHRFIVITSNINTIAVTAYFLDYLPPAPAYSSIGQNPTNASNSMRIKLRPNPSVSVFTVTASGAGSAQVVLKLADISGRILLNRSFAQNLPYSFGEELKPGVYFAEFRQGKKTTMVKLVKSGK